MAIVGIICEYNPFHRGHRKQFSEIRQRYGADAAIVCLMSGNYVQRGAPAVFDREIRARAAMLCGADLVLELPVTASLSSAEGFASAGVAILSPLCDYLCFGTESGNSDALMRTAQALLSPRLFGAAAAEARHGHQLSRRKAAGPGGPGHSGHTFGAAQRHSGHGILQGHSRPGQFSSPLPRDPPGQLPRGNAGRRKPLRHGSAAVHRLGNGLAGLRAAGSRPLL